MKNLSETTKKIKELSSLTKEDDDALLSRVGAHLLQALAMKNKDFFAIGGSTPIRVKITVEYEFASKKEQSL